MQKIQERNLSKSVDKVVSRRLVNMRHMCPMQSCLCGCFISWFYTSSFMICHILSLRAYLLVSTCAYVTQLLFACVAICYTKNLSSSDWMRVMFHPMAEPAQRKWEILKNQRCFPPKKNTDGGEGNQAPPNKKTPPYPPVHQKRVWLWKKPPPKNHRGKIPQVWLMEKKSPASDTEPARVAPRVSLRKDHPPLPGEVKKAARKG